MQIMGMSRMHKLLLLVATLQWGKLVCVDSDTTLMDYVAHNRAHYDATIASFADELLKFREGYKSRITTIGMQELFFSEKLVEAEHAIEHLQMLNDKSKICYSAQSQNIPNGLGASKDMTTCAEKFLAELGGFLEPAEEVQTEFQESYDDKFLNTLIDCTSNICLTRRFEALTATTNNKKRIFTKNMQRARFDADEHLQDSIECAFNVIYSIAYKNGQVNALMNDCTSGTIEDAKCLLGKGSSATKPCETVKKMALLPDDLKKDTIANPFLDLAADTKCVLFNLIPAPATI